MKQKYYAHGCCTSSVQLKKEIKPMCSGTSSPTEVNPAPPHSLARSQPQTYRLTSLNNDPRDEKNGKVQPDTQSSMYLLYLYDSGLLVVARMNARTPWNKD